MECGIKRSEVFWSILLTQEKSLHSLLVSFVSYCLELADLLIGCGINVANPKPTLSLDDLVSRYNSRYQANLPSCRPEDTLAKVLSTFEPMLEQLKSSGGFDPFIERYRRSWIHSSVLSTYVTI